jgi:2-oxoisovalerate dehydrogenase E1 component
VIENNSYAYSTPTCEQFCEGTELWKRAAGYGIEGLRLDCTTDVEQATRAFAAIIEKVRNTSRPVLVEAQVLRLRGHAAYDTGDYLKPGESEGFFARDPLPRARTQLIERIGAPKVEALETELNAFLEACVKVALATPRPSGEGMEADVFAPPARPLPWKAEPAEPAQLNVAQALNLGLRKILAERPESIVLGQDIATYGGAFKVTEHLLKDFGRSRVFNTPLAESACTGYSIGLALNGHRPIEEFQFADFATEATTQITLNAGTMHFRSGAACPLVLRLPTGGGLTFGSFHSQELDSFFLAMPGLKALYPSTPQDAFNALLAAYEDNNPVLLFEHKALYRRGRSSVAWDPNYRDVWQPRKMRDGDFATFVTYGEMVHLADEASDYFAAEYETNFDLFDLRALCPLPLDPIRASLQRTGRLIVLHEGRRTHGFGAEIVAKLTEENFSALKAPPLRIASLDLPVPFAPELEHAFRPTKEKIIDAISAWMG